MEQHEFILDAVVKFQKNYPLQFQLTNHNGRTKAIQELHDVVHKYGMKAIDGAWDVMHTVNKPQGVTSMVLSDLGPLYHEVFNAKLSLFLQNGSTMGNLVTSLCFAKKKILVQTNSHVSVFNGLRMGNAEISLIDPPYSNEFDMYLPVQPTQIEAVIQANPDIDVIYLTSPNYDGFVVDYSAVKKIIGDRILVIDEAHGAIQYFSTKTPKTALQSGADISICSLHKTTGTLMGTSILNVSKNSTFSEKKILESYFMMNTTSPNMVMLASVESAVKYLAKHGEQDVAEAIALNKSLRDHLNLISNVTIFEPEVVLRDPMKTIFKVNQLRGIDLAQILDEKYNIQIEKSTNYSIVVTVHINSIQEDINTFTAAISEIAKANSLLPAFDNGMTFSSLYTRISKKRKIVKSLIDVLASDRQERRISESIGMVSASMKYTCPPGYPFLVQGELILQEHAELLGPDCFVEVLID